MTVEDARTTPPRHAVDSTVLPIIAAVSVGHLLNDLMQSLIPAVYPLLKSSLKLDFGQIGLVTLVFQGTASILQPLVGLYTDNRPLPYALATGMGCTLAGLVLLSYAASFPLVLLSVALIGLGSAVFHPESSRVARLAAGTRPGFSQSFFQVGGNVGSSLGPLLAAFIVLPNGQQSIKWFAGVALAGMAVLTAVGSWYSHEGRKRAVASKARAAAASLPPKTVTFALAILVALMFSKFVYMASFSSYFTFYLIERFGLSVQAAQINLFIFLAAVALGTIVGGPIGDRIGRKRVIWVSILGVFPLSVALPYMGPETTVILSAASGMILASAFPAIVVYAQDLVPTKVGMIAGLFFGFAFGLGGIGAAVIGEIADHTSISYAYQLCSFLPLIGLLAFFLPDTRQARSVA